MYVKVNSLGLFGLNAFPIEVEVDISKGTPLLQIIGLPDQAVQESKERIRAALRTCDAALPGKRIIVNLAPADTKKTGSVTDLAITAALLHLTGVLPEQPPRDAAFIGEISLGGQVRPVNGVLPMVLLAQKSGIRQVFVPAENAYEASVAGNIAVYGVKDLQQMAMHLLGKTPIPPQPPYRPEKPDYYGDLDFADVKGQQSAKHALEIAAAGGHNVLLIGSPGSGKSMLAQRMPSILPAMTFEEAIETTNIHSISGLLDKNMPLVARRPFRAPHHTISAAGLVGGGSVPHPGEISLAHNGLLFLDELAEFHRNTLEVLRQPMEDQKVTITRTTGTVTYPSNFVLIGAMNPCPCGYYGHPKRACICGKKKVAQYLSKISGPLLDRFDLHVEAAPVEYENISSSAKEESSASIRERVQAAREIQQRRYRGTKITCNARTTSDILQEICVVEPDGMQLLQTVFERMGLSARAYDRILKVSRTLADMRASPLIDRTDIAQAVQYRSLDRKYWAE